MKHLNKKQLEYVDNIFRSFAYWYDENNEKQPGLAFFDYRKWLETEPQSVFEAAKNAETIHWMVVGLKKLK